MHFNLLLLIVCVLVCEAAGGIGGIFTAFSESAWFKSLRKPALQPPGRAVGPIWAGIYALMGAALYLVWRMPSDAPGRKIALILFALQLILSVLWPFFFLKMRHPFIAYVELLIMWMILLGTMIGFAYLSPPCLFLLAPVWLWVTFEAYLNFATVSLNDGRILTTQS